MLNNIKNIPVNDLKIYIDSIGIKTVKLASLSELNPQHLSKALCKTPDKKGGSPTTLGVDALRSLSFGIEQLSYDLMHSLITYDDSSEVLKANGQRYCPGCVLQIKQKLGAYISVIQFLEDTLGWSRSKVRNVIDIKRSTSYGNITRNDCDLINARLSSISEELLSFVF